MGGPAALGRVCESGRGLGGPALGRTGTAPLAAASASGAAASEGEEGRKEGCVCGGKKEQRVEAGWEGIELLQSACGKKSRQERRKRREERTVWMVREECVKPGSCMHQCGGINHG